MPAISVVLGDRKKSGRALSLNILRPEKGIAVVGVARNGLEAIAATARLKPRVLLLNLNIFKGKKSNLCWALRQKSPRTKIVLLTRRTPQAAMLDALCQGVRGYLEEAAIISFLPKAVRRVDAGEAWVPRKMVSKIIDRLAGHPKTPGR